jgi:CRP-like cAMP-binding protein
MDMTPDYRRFVPLNGLSDEALAQAAGQARPIRLTRGQILFRQGDSDDDRYYLLAGEMALDAGDESPPLVIRADSEAARHPLARLKPRRYTGIARSDCALAGFSDRALENLVAQDQATSYEVTEFEGDDPSWMFDLLRNPAFSRVPPANLHVLFGRFEPMSVVAGQVVIQQGDAGDYYYLIRQGRAQVSRSGSSGRPVELARLEPGQGFGEEALISGAPRNATVTMLGDGLLMRLAAEDFHAQLQEPLVHLVDAAEAAALIRDRAAQLVDVRMEDEFRHGSLAGAVNIPLYLLRVKANALARDRIYILFSHTIRRGGTAAFLLAQRGFDVRVLRGGLAGLKKPLASE